MVHRTLAVVGVKVSIDRLTHSLQVNKRRWVFHLSLSSGTYLVHIQLCRSSQTPPAASDPFPCLSVPLLKAPPELKYMLYFYIGWGSWCGRPHIPVNVDVMCTVAPHLMKAPGTKAGFITLLLFLSPETHKPNEITCPEGTDMEYKSLCCTTQEYTEQIFICVQFFTLLIKKTQQHKGLMIVCYKDQSEL